MTHRLGFSWPVIHAIITFVDAEYIPKVYRSTAASDKNNVVPHLVLEVGSFLKVKMEHINCINTTYFSYIYFLCDSTDSAFKQGRCLFTSRISCPRPPMLRSACRGRNSLQFTRPYGKRREQEAH